jgi:hypothetical protein
VGLRPLACWDGGFESHCVHGCLSLVFCVVRVEVPESGWSPIQRGPTECSGSECEREASKMRRSWPTRGFCDIEKITPTNKTSLWCVPSKANWNTGFAGPNSAQGMNVRLCCPVQVEPLRLTDPCPKNPTKCLHIRCRKPRKQGASVVLSYGQYNPDLYDAFLSLSIATVWRMSTQYDLATRMLCYYM